MYKISEPKMPKWYAENVYEFQFDLLNYFTKKICKEKLRNKHNNIPDTAKHNVEWNL